jgi:hypothetical protein
MILGHWSSDNFPQSYSLSIDKFPGFLNELSCVTDVVLSLDIVEINTVWEQGSQVHDLRYSNKRTITWEIPQ